MSGPTLATDRLVLRPFRAADKDAYAAIRLNPANTRFLADLGADAVVARGATDASVDAFRAAWHDGFGPWAVEDRTSGALMGHLGLRYLEELGETELLYMLDHRFWGRGYAAEGGRAALAFGFQDLGLPRIIAVAKPENTASIAVMERVGMRRRPGLHRAFGFDVVRYEIEAP
ncbi:MAG: GNAT family N-acetyltransferase [Pseudomonadota bacterium]